MAKVTSKLQVTIPKAMAERYGIGPGDEIEFRAAGAEIRVVPPRLEQRELSVAERLRLFRAARDRQRAREAAIELPPEPVRERGWTRTELYERGPGAPSELQRDDREDPDS
jgi:AbrB family looped-hinge helix DNA binding protein